MLTIEFSATIFTEVSSGSSRRALEMDEPPLDAGGDLVHPDLDGGRIASRPSRAAERVDQAALGADEDVRQSPGRARVPRAMVTPSPPERRKLSRICDHGLAPTAPARRPMVSVLSAGDWRTKTDADRPPDRDGEGAVDRSSARCRAAGRRWRPDRHGGLSDRGRSRRALPGGAIPDRRLNITLHSVGEVGGDLRRSEAEPRPHRARLGDELVAARSLDQEGR